MMFYHSFQSVLEAEARELSQPVRAFCGTLAVYEGEADSLEDSRCWQAYLDALDAVRRWLRLVTLLDLAESLQTAAYVLLYLPEEDIQVDSRVEAEICQSARSLPGVLYPAPGEFSQIMERRLGRTDCFHRGSYELINTPIGRMDYLTYRCVIDIADNPVSLLYRHFSLLLRQIHGILEAHGEPYDVLGSALLAEHGIHDVLGVYRLDSLLSGVDQFLDGRKG